MVLSEDYKRRLAELCGLIPDNVEIIVEDSAVANPYAFSKNRIPQIFSTCSCEFTVIP